LQPTTQIASKPSLHKVVDRRRFTGSAPLVQTDIHELGDERLNPEENVARLREELLQQEAKKKIWGQEELEDPERSSGPCIPWARLIGRLQKCNPGIRVRDGIPGNVALYFRKRPDEYTEVDEIILLNPELARSMDIPVPDDDFFVHHKYVGGFEMKPMPEWAHVTLDSSEIAHREVRGWRSVLIALIKARVITYEAAVAEFGDPETDSRSGRWFDQVAKFKRQ
jgi:hypothetical protein